LKVFEALAYAHIKKDKLVVRVVKCIFIGYLEGVKGYKLWKSKYGVGSRVLISRDHGDFRTINKGKENSI